MVARRMIPVMNAVKLMSMMNPGWILPMISPVTMAAIHPEMAVGTAWAAFSKID